MKWLCVGLMLALPLAAVAETWSGKVASVQTGDRLTAKRGKSLVKVRLAGIEAPQLQKRGGKDSRLSLSGLCKSNRKLTVEVTAPPVKGVVTGKVYCNWSGKFYADAGLYQVEQGMAALLASETDPDYVRAQAQAQFKCIGIWAGSGVHCPSSSPVFTCDGRVYCSQMTSCSEATYFLNNCPGTKMDGDNDGIACEQQWCN
ncbi:thermonuclease family protein [Methylomagnum sp.]